jgi:Spy/CpxP family protein refolding chaperone
MTSIMRKYVPAPLAAALACAAVLSIVPVLAQTPGATPAAPAEKADASRRDRRAAKRERIAQELGLTAEQRARMEQIRETDREALRTAHRDVAAKREALRDAMLADPTNQAAIDARANELAAARAEMQRRALATEQRVLQVLTPEQRERARQMRGERAGRLKTRVPRVRPR